MSRVLTNLLVQLRRTALSPANRATDAELLDRFVRQRDAVAFELLFWRHGPMVWGVCRRILGNSSDADDAFQAAFLVLTHKAKSIGDGAALAGWLHRVAWRTALNARKGRSRRIIHERPADPLPELPCHEDPARGAANGELRDAIDQELARLPEKFRLPLILCDLESRTRESVAADLNCPLGTLNSRLSRARAKLRDRLLRRGVSLSGLAAPAVPPGVASATLHTLTQLPSASVQALADGVIHSLTLVTLKKLASGVAMCALLAAGVTAGTMGEPGRKQPVPPTLPVAQAKASDEPNFIDPDAGPLPPDAVARIGSTRLRHTGEVTGLLYSPDGKWLASVSNAPEDATARLWDAASGRERFRVPVNAQAFDARSNPRALGFTSDSHLFLVADVNSIRAFEVVGGKERFSHPIGAKPAAGRRGNAPPRVADNRTALSGVGISPDGGSFVLAWQGGRIEVRDVASGDVRATGEHPFGNYHYLPVEIAKDGSRFILGATGDEPIPVFDAASCRSISEIKLKGAGGNHIRFMPDGESLVILTAGPPRKEVIAFVRTKTGQIDRTVDVDSMPYVFAVSADGKVIATGSGQLRSSQLIDVASGKELGRIPSTPSMGLLTFSPDGKLLAGGSLGGGGITIWDVGSRGHHPIGAEPIFFNHTVFSPDGRAVIPWVRGRPWIDWRTGNVVRRLAAVEPDAPINAELSADAKHYAMAARGGAIRLLDAVTGEEVRTLKGDASMIGRMKFSRDGQRLASCGRAAIGVWNTVGGEPIARFTPAGLSSQDWPFLSDDGRVLGACIHSGGSNGSALCTWDVTTQAPLARIELSQSVNWAALSPDGRFVAGGVGQDRRQPDPDTPVSIWDATTGRELHRLPGHLSREPRLGASCSFSPDSRWLVTGDETGRLRVWEVLSGQEALEFVGHRTFVTANFSPDGRLLVAASQDAPCFVWDVTGTASNVPPAVIADPKQLWRDLADADAKKAFLAIRQLVARPDPAVALIRQNLKPTVIDSAQIGKLIRELDSPAFTVREAATAALAKLADRAESALREARRAASAEATTRIDSILTKAAAPSSERLRQSRALGALELIATPEAVKLLDALARGNPGDRLTADAGESAKRLRSRGVR